MDKSKIKYFIIFGLLISFLIVVVTGIMKFGVLLRAVGISLDYASLPMARISAWHDWAGVAMLVFGLVHVIANFEWIISTTKSFFEKNDKRV